MRIAHVAIVTPHRAGLYETVRDLVAAERSLGADAIIVDPKAITEDRGVPIGAQLAPSDFDVIINHSGLGEWEKPIALAKGSIPLIHCIHGRPESSFRLENSGIVSVYTFLANTAKLPHYQRFVTFWPDHVAYWASIIPTEKLRCITAPVDLETWTPKGPAGYSFNGNAGDVNLVIADMWREDTTPYHTLHAAVRFAEGRPGTKVHIYGRPQSKALDVILNAMRAKNVIGEVASLVKGLANVYRAATMVVTPHKIAVRTVREALACGCPVQRRVDSADTLIRLPASDSERDLARLYAEENYDSKTSAKQMLDICKELLDGTGNKGID